MNTQQNDNTTYADTFFNIEIDFKNKKAFAIEFETGKKLDSVFITECDSQAISEAELSDKNFVLSENFGEQKAQTDLINEHRSDAMGVIEKNLNATAGVINMMKQEGY